MVKKNYKVFIESVTKTNTFNTDVITTKTPIKTIIIQCLLVFIVSKLLFAYQYEFLMTNVFKSDASFISSWMHWWDNFWYLRIIEYGYDPKLINHAGQAAWAFFPGLPIIVKFFMIIFNSSAEYTGLIIN
jgi:hypothetical protein